MCRGHVLQFHFLSLIIQPVNLTHTQGSLLGDGLNCNFLNFYFLQDTTSMLIS